MLNFCSSNQFVVQNSINLFITRIILITAADERIFLQSAARERIFLIQLAHDL